MKTEHLASMVERLRDFPANGKLPQDDVTLRLIAEGLVAEHEVKRPCRSCGAEKTDYRYMKPTAAGRLLVEAWDAGRTEEVCS
jgi:hypothetical protein